jgi:hypothetical protein
MRFISRDPVGYRGGVNLYEYAKSNPLKYFDLQGESPEVATPGAGEPQVYTESNLFLPCPPTVDGCRGNGSWVRYPNRTGEVSFHCGYECYLEHRIPEPDGWMDPKGPQNECCYQDNGKLAGGDDYCSFVHDKKI